MLSHASCMQVGALPYLNKMGLVVRVIATSPVAKLGAQSLHEIYISKKESPQA